MSGKMGEKVNILISWQFALEPISMKRVNLHVLEFFMFIYISVQIIVFQIFLSNFFESYDQWKTFGNCNNSTVKSLKFKVLGTRDFILNY